MNRKIFKLITAVILACTGIFIFVMSNINDWPFGIGGLGIALTGISIQTYIEHRKDKVTEKGEKRSDIEVHDERNVWVNAKSGETMNSIMDFLTLIAFIVSIYLDVSLTAQVLIFSLLLFRILISPVVKKVYQNQL